MHGILSAIEPGADQALYLVEDDRRLSPQHLRPRLRTIANVVAFMTGTIVQVIGSEINPVASRRAAWRMVDEMLADVRRQAENDNDLESVLKLFESAIGSKVSYALPRLVPRIAAGHGPAEPVAAPRPPLARWPQSRAGNHARHALQRHHRDGLGAVADRPNHPCGPRQPDEFSGRDGRTFG